ncbi:MULTISPECIES: kelch repeat-containing protein [unclassified Myxococcus]|uniref:Kelch repeat-containing protein n=1 Tax=unclassified Myxococcus TaxID=2648731 RepID=UPI001CBCE8C6|nr:hypothetical protein [Myxococcus sp. AS-1-15]MBZ4409254.1 hypothetical protein [Myxococcus sp. XM-1-1-1]
MSQQAGMKRGAALLGVFFVMACGSPAPKSAEPAALVSQQTRVLTASPTYNRTGFTQTTLADGRVLVAGGTAQGAPADFRATELYTPGASTPWSTTGDMVVARYEHAATRLQDGRVLVSGGITPLGNGRDAELYDPATGTWTATGSLIAARARHTQTLLQNGKVLVVGGDGTATTQGLGSAELYDPATGTWTLAASPSRGGYSGHTATLLRNGDVLLLGNRNQHERYRPSTNTWIATANSGAVLAAGHSATLLTTTVNGEVLVVGPQWQSDVPSQMASRYDPVANTWTTAIWAPFPRVGHGAVELSNGSVLVVGGYHPTTGAPAQWVSRYDIGTGGWTALTALALARRDFGMSLVGNAPDQVLLNGGWNVDSNGVWSRQPSELYSTGCVPKTSCLANNWQCGSPSDGCGGKLECGSCGVGYECNPLNYCESSCVPDPLLTTCQNRCGCVANNCGTSVNCGPCPDGGACPTGQQLCCDGVCRSKNECFIIACATSAQPHESVGLSCAPES